MQRRPMADWGSNRRVNTALVSVAALALGVLAEHVAYDAREVRFWGADLAVGWGLVALGLVGSRLAPSSRCGALVCAAGFAWFLGNFAGSDNPAIAWLGEHGAYLHRALLAQALLGFPSGRLTSSAGRVVAALAYVSVLWPSLATSDTATLLLGAAVLAVVVRVGEREAIPAGIGFFFATTGVAAGRILLAPVHADTLLLLYEGGLLFAAGALIAALSGRSAVTAVVDRVIELGETELVRDALRRVLDDLSLEIGFRRDGRFIDERGGELLLPSAREHRLTSFNPSQDIVVVHDPALVLGPRLLQAISRSLRLTSERARLQAETGELLAELRASRRRLVLSRGRQRALLARRLHERVEQRLISIDATLSTAAPETEFTAAALSRARRQVEEARQAIAGLARGLQPAALAAEGLAGALRELAERSTVPVALSVDARRFDAAVEHAAWLVCSEALANVTKHAHASAAEVTARVLDGRLELQVADDGLGGARIDGSGLTGLAVRVQELGGTMRLMSPASRGTVLAADIPLRAGSEGADIDLGLVPELVG